jgi:hypothetical protein
MNLPFIKDVEKNPDKKAFHKVIQKEAWKITKLAVTRKLNNSHIDKLEKLYISYFDKFPDDKEKSGAMQRISKLRHII